MENEDILQEMAHLSRLVGKNEKAESLRSLCNNTFFEAPDISKRYVSSNHIKCEEKSNISSHKNAITSTGRSVYVNRKMLGSPVEPIVQSKETGVIYCNPKFMNPIYQKVPIKREQENTKIHVNPKFLAKTSSIEPKHEIKSERVYVNPMFLNNSQVYPEQYKTTTNPGSFNSKTVCVKDENPSGSQVLPANRYKLINKRKRKSSTSTVPKNFPKGDFLLRKYSLKRRKSIGIEEKQKTLKRRKSSSESKAQELDPLQKVGKLKLVRMSRLKKHQESTSENYSNSKANLVRKGNPSFQNPMKLVRTPNSKINNLYEANPIQSGRKPKTARTPGIKRQRSDESDPLQRVGKMKLVRMSILQSQIVARRRLTSLSHARVKMKASQPLVQTSSSKFRYVRKRLSTDSNKLQPVNKRRSRLPVHSAKQTPHNSKTRKSLVCIEGVVYRSTHHKLTRRNSLKAGSVIRVRGVRYRLGNGGKTLQRLDKNSDKEDEVQSVSIRGVMYKPSSDESGTLLRREIPKSRTILRSAKRKSIAILTAKLRKRNEPCTFFVRFGYCKGIENQTCHKLHERKYVTLCKQYLRGKCEKKSCLLSHEPVPEKMPLCEHYLNGLCLRDACPYLHIKHGQHTPLCRLFLRGFCPKGPHCSDRHEFVCPILAKKGTCPKRAKCPYPHPNKYKYKYKEKKGAEEASGSGNKPTEVSSQRYFRVDLNLSEGSGVGTKQEDEGSDQDDPDSPLERAPFPKLPEYLPLS